MNLIDRIADRSGEFLLFALTPPRATSAGARAQEIADATLTRLRTLDLDGLILYDLADQDPATVLAVLVGAAGSSSMSKTSLATAQALSRQVSPSLLVGGVAISERHSRREDEHLRLIAKQDAGNRFFVTQVVFDVNAAKNLVSDYHYLCAERRIEVVPVVFTFSVCGSMRTLELLRWLGVDVPRWIENDLKHASDVLHASYRLALTTATDLIAYCRRLGVPFGISVESVSSRRVEIEMAVQLAEQLATELLR